MFIMKKLLFGALLALSVCGDVLIAGTIGFAVGGPVSNARARRTTNRARMRAEAARLAAEQAAVSEAAIRQAIELTDRVSETTAASLRAEYPHLYPKKGKKTGSFVAQPLSLEATHVSAIHVEMHFLAELTGALCECPICWPDGEACFAVATAADDASASEEPLLAKLVNALRFGR